MTGRNVLSDRTASRMLRSIGDTENKDVRRLQGNQPFVEASEPLEPDNQIWIVRAPAGGITGKGEAGELGFAEAELVDLVTVGSDLTIADFEGKDGGPGPTVGVWNWGPEIPAEQLCQAIPDGNRLFVHHPAPPSEEEEEKPCPARGQIVLDESTTDIDDLTGDWTEIIPPAIVTGFGQNVVLGSNNGRLKIQHQIDPPPRLSGLVHFDLSVQVSGTNQQIEFSFAINGQPIPSAAHLRQVVTTAGNHTQGLSFPVSLTALIDTGIFEDVEFSVIARSQTPNTTIEILSFAFLIEMDLACEHILDAGTEAVGPRGCAGGTTQREFNDDYNRPNETLQVPPYAAAVGSVVSNECVTANSPATTQVGPQTPLRAEDTDTLVFAELDILGATQSPFVITDMEFGLWGFALESQFAFHINYTSANGYTTVFVKDSTGILVNDEFLENGEPLGKVRFEALYTGSNTWTLQLFRKGKLRFQLEGIDDSGNPASQLLSCFSSPHFMGFANGSGANAVVRYDNLRSGWQVKADR